MPTALNTPVMRFVSHGFGIAPIQFKKDNGALVFQRVAVFRSGTFRDSMGDQNTWEELHMQQMVENYNYLRNTGVFRDVPVRDGHPGWIMNNTPGTGAVVGWHTGLTAETLASPLDGEKYDYLLADYEITEPYAVEKIERGTWRNRSSEILRYITNREAEYWPVYGGFAFVDIPAVEGLNFSRDKNTAGADNVRLFVMMDKEFNVTAPAPGTPAQPSQPSQPATPAPSQPAQPTVPSPATPSPSPSPGTGTPSSHAASAQHMFTVNGVPTTDFAAVQQHITTLEAYRSEVRNASRADFVSGLARLGLILNNEETITQLTQFSQSLTDEQFEMWRKGYESASPLSVVSVHAAPAAHTGGSPISAGPNMQDPELDAAKQIVSYHRSNGMAEDKLKGTASYRKLVAAGLEKA